MLLGLLHRFRDSPKPLKKQPFDQKKTRKPQKSSCLLSLFHSFRGNARSWILSFHVLRRSVSESTVPVQVKVCLDSHIPTVAPQK